MAGRSNRSFASGGLMSPGAALSVLRVCLGVFLIAKGLGKLDFILDSTSLVERLVRWSNNEALPALSRSYSQALIPAAPVLARLVLVGELGGGLALIAGYRTSVVALLAALMVANFHLATGSLFTVEFLTDANGFLTVAALFVLALAGRDLPWRLTKT
jgi:uncharacterized membrane protein YphA (DoxX/SURF4 family)